GMRGRKADSREATVIVATVPGVLRQQERMMNAVLAPKRNAILVILAKLRKDWCALYIGSVVGIEPNKEKPCSSRVGSLIGLLNKERIQYCARMCLKHAFKPIHMALRTSLRYAPVSSDSSLAIQVR